MAFERECAPTSSVVRGGRSCGRRPHRCGRCVLRGLGGEGVEELVDTGLAARGGTAEAVLLARTGRAARADDLRLTRRALGDPADVEDLAHGLELAARAARDRGAPAAAAASRLDLVDDLARVDPLGRERRREID